MEYKEHVIKKKSGKTRKIVAPDEELKTYQRAQLRKLETQFKAESIAHGIEKLDMFHGFLKGKNCVTAATKHIGHKYTIMMDIENFFDSVCMNHIPPALEIDPLLFHKEGYAAQGFPTSPMVANIALVPVLADIVAAFKEELPFLTLVTTIYADDICISGQSTEYTAHIQSIVKRKFNENGFHINEKKTRIKYAKHGYRRILGVNVGDDHVRATRKTMYKIRAARHQAGTDKRAGQSLGGLTTWSQCLLPRKARANKIKPITYEDIKNAYSLLSKAYK